MAPTFFFTICLFIKAEGMISRDSFPPGFVFGTASSAYQFEGAVTEEKKGLSIWDTFTRKPGRILDFSNADVAVDQYHRFKVEVCACMRERNQILNPLEQRVGKPGRLGIYAFGGEVNGTSYKCSFRIRNR